MYPSRGYLCTSRAVNLFSTKPEQSSSTPALHVRLCSANRMPPSNRYACTLQGCWTCQAVCVCVCVCQPGCNCGGQRNGAGPIFRGDHTFHKAQAAQNLNVLLGAAVHMRVKQLRQLCLRHLSCSSHCVCCECSFRLLLGTEAAIMTPNGVDFSFLLL